MLTITIQVNAPSGQAIGIKEDIAAYLEKFGDASVVSIVCLLYTSPSPRDCS